MLELFWEVRYVVLGVFALLGGVGAALAQHEGHLEEFLRLACSFVLWAGIVYYSCCYFPEGDTESADKKGRKQPQQQQEAQRSPRQQQQQQQQPASAQKNQGKAER
eukprot:TRINITY_DN21353_c1_g1_i5.p3 TRINITY_DN21353_c1_g1~~TRINITY_DN21353_c1_g1_i5.p3  ORF type:complete len:106 (+),score=32.53 TRINITY_DN21353_c1_g1_i5:92-409(+)